MVYYYFIIDHQLRVQEQTTSPQGQSLQAFASLLNSTGTSILSVAWNNIYMVACFIITILAVLINQS